MKMCSILYLETLVKASSDIKI